MTDKAASIRWQLCLLAQTEEFSDDVRNQIARGVWLIDLLRATLAEPREPVAHRVVAGALFDFMGWLTSRRERLVLSSTDDAAPAADAIKDFAELRGLSRNDAEVKEGQDNITAPPQRLALTEEEIRDLLEAEFLGGYGMRSWDDDLQVFRLAERAHEIGGEV